MPPTSPDSPTDVGQRPKDQQWEPHKERIRQLYITENRKLKDVITIMKEEYGFEATSRMFKGRFNAWGMTSKNINLLEYKAMSMVYKDNLDKNCVAVMFSVPKGPDKRVLRIADVQKELNRPINKKKNELNRNEIKERDINLIFSRLGIEVIWPGPDFQPDPDMDARVSTESPSTCLDSDSDQEIFKGEELPAVNLDSLVTYARVSMESASTCLDSDFNQEVLTREALAAINPNPLDSNTLLLHPSRINAQPAELEKDVLVDPMLTKCDEGLESNPPPSTLPQQTKAIRDARIWAWHLFETCIKTDEKRADDAAGKHRKDGYDMFNRMLRTSNPYILSSLIYITGVFHGLRGADNYRWILQDCCEMISRDLSKYRTYAIPEGYALACETSNRADVSKFGAQLLNDTGHSGYMSSNRLVFQQLKAHHLLEHLQDAKGALEVLTCCIDESSRCLETNHSVNVSGINLLARAHERLGQIRTAYIAYADAVHRSAEVFGPRHPFRTSLVRNMASLQAKLGMPVVVEKNLRWVLWCRNEVLGPGHEYTYSSAQELRQFLEDQGRHDDAAREEERREALYREEKHWRVLSETDAAPIRQQRRTTGLYWEKPEGVFKYVFVMPKEAYTRVDAQSSLWVP